MPLRIIFIYKSYDVKIALIYLLTPLNKLVHRYIYAPNFIRMMLSLNDTHLSSMKWEMLGSSTLMSRNHQSIPVGHTVVDGRIQQAFCFFSYVRKGKIRSIVKTKKPTFWQFAGFFYVFSFSSICFFHIRTRDNTSVVSISYGAYV